MVNHSVDHSANPMVDHLVVQDLMVGQGLMVVQGLMVHRLVVLDPMVHRLVDHSADQDPYQGTMVDH